MNGRVIKRMADDHAIALRNVLEAKEDIAQLENDIAIQEAYVLRRGYELDKIDGANRQERDRQEKTMLAEDGALNSLQAALKIARDKLLEAEVELQRIRTKVSLYRAHMYSMSGHPNEG